jgi:hypothetical protein
MENQHGDNQRENQGSETARKGQPQALSPEYRQLAGLQIAPVLPNSQNARRSERLRTVSLVLGQVAKRHTEITVSALAASQLPQQTPFALELPDN